MNKDISTVLSIFNRVCIANQDAIPIVDINPHNCLVRFDLTFGSWTTEEHDRPFADLSSSYEMSSQDTYWPADKKLANKDDFTPNLGGMGKRGSPAGAHPAEE
jgi:hypothetical protein